MYGDRLALVTPPGRAPAARDPESAGVSALVRPAHQPERRLDVPPRRGLFVLALRFQAGGLLLSLGHGLGAVRFQELTCIVLDIDFPHSHGSLLFAAWLLRRGIRTS